MWPLQSQVDKLQAEIIVTNRWLSDREDENVAGSFCCRPGRAQVDCPQKPHLHIAATFGFRTARDMPKASEGLGFTGFNTHSKADPFFLGKTRVGHTGEVLSERTRLLRIRMFLMSSSHFHAEASSKNPTREVAQSLHCALLQRITLLTGLVYSLRYVGRGIKLCVGTSRRKK